VLDGGPLAPENRLYVATISAGTTGGKGTHMDPRSFTPRPRRFRTGLLLGAVFLAGVTFGPVAGRLGARFGYTFGLAPAAFADVTGNSDTYRLLTLFGDVFERVRADYVDPVPDKDLVENAVNGMLTGLDPHSNYMDAKAFRDMQVQTKGEFGGLGIEVTMEDGLVKVVAPIDETPAAKAGVMANDIITHLDDEAVQGLTLNQAVEKMRGPEKKEIGKKKIK